MQGVAFVAGDQWFAFRIFTLFERSSDTDFKVAVHFVGSQMLFFIFKKLIKTNR